MFAIIFFYAESFAKDVKQFHNWEQPIKTIKIVKNDNWKGLEKKYGISSTLLQRYNKLKPNSTLKIGMEIKIPAKAVHQIKQGETALSIAKEYGMKFSELITLNQINDPNNLIIGQKIKIVLMRMQLELSWPADGKVVSSFGPQNNGTYNSDIYILVEKNGKIRAAAPGVIVYAGNEIGNYGNLVIIQHLDQEKWFSSYGNLDIIKVQKGNAVNRDQIIGEIELDKSAEKKELYFGLRHGTKSKNPLYYLREKNK